MVVPQQEAARLPARRPDWLLHCFQYQGQPLPPHYENVLPGADRGVRQKDLLPVFGSDGIASEVCNGKRGISKAQAKKLAAYFGVAADLFI